jgi:hypothetical protein
MRSCLLVAFALSLSACNRAAPPAAGPPAAGTPSAAPAGEVAAPATPAAARPATSVGEDGAAASVGPVASALDFVPASATAVFIRDHKALEEFGLPFLTKPSEQHRGVFDEYFLPREMELSATVLCGQNRDIDQFAAALRLAPGASVQRMVNALELKRDDQTYPGYVCYRRDVEQGQAILIAERNGVIAFSTEALLRPRLQGKHRPGPIETRLRALAADHQLLVCCLTDYRGLEFAAPYFQPLGPLLELVEQDIRDLRPGSLSAIAIGLRLRGQPRVVVQLEAADESLAGDMESSFQQALERVQQRYAAARNDLRSRLPPESAAAIDEFLAASIAGLKLRRTGVLLEITAPLGRDGEELKRFAALVAPREVAAGRHLQDALAAVQAATKLHDPREQLKQIGFALHNHHDVFGHFPANSGTADKPLLSWRVALLPYLEQGELYKQFKLDEPWDSEHNKPLLARLPPIYRDQQVEDPSRTTFQVFTGEGTAFGNEKFNFANITDGTSNTIAVIKTPPEKAVPWTKPEDLKFMEDNPLSVLGRIPPEGIGILLFDGAVVRLPADYPEEMWRRLIQPSDGSVVELPGR